jgi:EAL domain-containing protein (putative c-di-GMP-specific phosphodiesterase class I)
VIQKFVHFLFRDTKEIFSWPGIRPNITGHNCCNPETAALFSERSFLVDIADIIANDRIKTVFQPVFCFSRGKVIGLEALSRFKAEDGTYLPPMPVFLDARRQGSALELDRACRYKAVSSFQGIQGRPDDLMLFLNFDMSVITRENCRNGLVRKTCDELGLSPENVVIEILESEIEDTEVLCDFVERYRSFGCTIAMDDIGCGHSNMDRIALIMPDLIKIDRSLISGVQENTFKQASVCALAALADKTGALVVAEGVETEAELHQLMDLGVDFFQGFLLGRPKDLLSYEETGALLDIRRLSETVLFRKRKMMVENWRKVKDWELSAGAVQSALCSRSFLEMEKIIKSILCERKEVECAYVLDWSGTMATSTVFNPSCPCPRSGLFRPSVKGENMSLKDYYIYIANGARQFISDPYISKATGTLCRTLSRPFNGPDGAKLMVCLDIIQS